jgi:hypothetical protein
LSASSVNKVLKDAGLAERIKNSIDYHPFLVGYGVVDGIVHIDYSEDLKGYDLLRNEWEHCLEYLENINTSFCGIEKKRLNLARFFNYRIGKLNEMLGELTPMTNGLDNSLYDFMVDQGAFIGRTQMLGNRIIDSLKPNDEINRIRSTTNIIKEIQVVYRSLRMPDNEAER